MLVETVEQYKKSKNYQELVRSRKLDVFIEIPKSGYIVRFGESRDGNSLYVETKKEADSISAQNFYDGNSQYESWEF